MLSRIMSCLAIINFFYYVHGYTENYTGNYTIERDEYICANGTVVDDNCSCPEMNTLCQWRPCLTGNESVLRRHLCDGVFDCADLSDECLCDRRTTENSNAYDICANVLEPEDGHHEGRPKGNVRCKQTKRGENAMYIRKEQICDSVSDCPDAWDETSCRRSKAYDEKQNAKGYVTYFSCDNGTVFDIPQENVSSITGLSDDHATWALIDWRRKFDGVADCPNIKDEWYDNFVYCGENETSLGISRCQGDDGVRLFATPSNAVESLVFPFMEWFFGVFGFIGNTIVAVNSITSIVMRRERNRHSVTEADDNSSDTNLSRVSSGKIINHILVLFLCFSDWLMSVQIIMMASANEYFRGQFWEYDKAWQSSAACSVVGSLAVFSTQASAFMIVVISYVRLYAVSKPFSYLRVRCVVIACILTYAIATLLMLIPVMSFITSFDLYFTTAVQVPNPPQVDAVILERDKLELYVRKIAVLSGTSGREGFSKMTWSQLDEFVTSINPDFGHWLYFGYYSQISICIPPIVSHWSDPGLLYSFVLLVIDFCAFLLVFIAYYVVFRTTRRGRDSCIMAVGCCAHHRPPAVQQEVEISPGEEIPTRPRAKSMTRDEEDYEMQKRILWIIGTDCVCWAPICLLTLSCMINENIKGTNTLLVAMFAVQINCVVNPLVYSRKVRGAVKQAFAKCRWKIGSWVNCLRKRRSSTREHATEGRVNAGVCLDSLGGESTSTESLDESTLERQRSAAS